MQGNQRKGRLASSNLVRLQTKLQVAKIPIVKRVIAEHHTTMYQDIGFAMTDD